MPSSRPRGPLKVLFLSYQSGEYCVRLASSLARRSEVRLVIAAPEAQPFLDRLDPAVQFRPFDAPRLRQPLQQLRTIRGILEQIREFDPDVIHVQSGQLWMNFALPFLARYPLVLTVHDPVHHSGDWDSRKTPQWVVDFGYRRASRWIVHAERLKKMLVERLALPEEHVHVIPTVTRGDDRLCRTVVEAEPNVLFFGRIFEYKGLEYLIRAEPLISSRVPDVRFTIAGRGEGLERYRRLMTNPERYTLYNEYVSEERRAELFRQASVVALPYVDASQSGVIPVAYAYGKPVVATTVGGLPEMVEHGSTGLLVPPRDEQALARAIVRLLEDATLRGRLGASGKAKLERECAPDVVADETLAVYSAAASSKRALGQGEAAVHP